MIVGERFARPRTGLGLGETALQTLRARHARHALEHDRTSHTHIRLHLPHVRICDIAT